MTGKGSNKGKNGCLGYTPSGKQNGSPRRCLKGGLLGLASMEGFVLQFSILTDHKKAIFETCFLPSSCLSITGTYVVHQKSCGKSGYVPIGLRQQGDMKLARRPRHPTVKLLTWLHPKRRHLGNRRLADPRR